MKKLLGVLLVAGLFSVMGFSSVSATIGVECSSDAGCNNGEFCDTGSTPNVCAAEVSGTPGNLNQPADSLPTTGIPTSGTDLIDRIALIGNWIFAIFLAISVIYIVLAAFEFVTGAGDPAKVSGARQKLIYAAVGIGVALLAAGIDDIVRSIVVGS
ncbi:MAG: hypothetical protein HY482_02355 [Candidatus Wildermuthbacteria bacterium]|nr:hypothetical protein [Candidatus Wildermuthbacteria bacterium]